MAEGDSSLYGVLVVFKSCVFGAVLFLTCYPVLARPHLHHHHQTALRSVIVTGDDEHVIGGRPAGCPHAFCGCEASLYLFHRIIPELNLAWNWRRFPRAAPAPGMAAVRPGHVMILQSQIAGNVWSVHDGNSGNHLTREHARSIAGYIVVNPGSAFAMMR